MSKTKLTLIACLICLTSIAQTGINYKALIKDANGNVVSNSDIEVRFELLQGLATDPVYREIHNPTTDDNGIVVLTIGQGATTDDIRDVEWILGEVLLNVKIDTGSGLVDMGTTEFQYVPFAYATEIAAEAKNVTGLEAINEGNGIGWRLIGRNPNFHGTLGNNAVDLSWSTSDIQAFGANGAGSFAAGGGVRAIGNYSTSLGFGTEASGLASTALGFITKASGVYATAIGNEVDAEAFSSLAIGRFNEGGGSFENWNGFDPLFEIGNGSSEIDRSNALTVLKNGTHRINSSYAGIEIDAQVRGITIAETLDDGIEISNSGDNGVFIFRPNNDGINIREPGDDGIFVLEAGDDGLTIQQPSDNGVVVTQAGNLGAIIEGTTAGLRASSSESQNPDIILGTTGGGSLQDDGIISTAASQSSSDMYLRSYDAVVVQLDYDNNESGNFRIRDGNQDIAFDVTESGNVTMGTRLRMEDITLENTSPTPTFNILDVNSTIRPNEDDDHFLGLPENRWISVWAVDGTINTSDKREKKHIKSLNYGLSEVLQMNPVSFKWKDRTDQDTKLGLIAQELLELVPEVVIAHTWEKDETTGNITKKELNRLGVYYSDLIPVLIKAIQEQNQIIQNQEEALKASNKNYQTLLSRIEILESKSSN